MTLEQAQELSEALARHRFSFTVAVGYHGEQPNRAETSYPGVHARVDTGVPRSRLSPLTDHVIGPDGATVADRVALLDSIAKQHGLLLETGIMGDGLTFSTIPGSSV